ncbi:MAG: YbaB/EbfC family nucleoid-associated protein [Candidatus Kerfeldbacteria bacterium]|nr:YbaB/EbfC family nucleoid-associated protein [Candidatus Kerfeldbacteria bacterium]
MASMLSKLKQYKDMRSQAKSVQSVLEKESVTSDAAGGKIRLVMNGNQKVTSLEIDNSLLSPDNKTKIQQGLIDALDEATKKLQRLMAKKIQSGEMTMPDLSGLR